MAFKRNFLRNVFIFGSYNFLSQFVVFLASLITSRLLLPSDFGLVALIAVFSNFISIFSDSGISYAVIRSRYQHTYYRGLNTVSVLIGVLLCLVFGLLIYPVSLFYKNPAIILPALAIAFLFIARSLNIVPMAILQKQLKFSTAGRILLISAVVSTASTIIMAYAGLKYWSLIWSQFINCFVTSLLIYKTRMITTFSFRKPVLIKSFGLTRSLIGNITAFNSINYWARNCDNLIVGRYYGAADLGIYNRAYLMLMLPLNLITGLFSSVLYPSLVKHKNEGGNVESEYYFILKVISLLNLPIAIVLILVPDFFVKILWGESWMAVAKLLPYFGLLVMTQTLTSTLGSVLVLERKEKLLMYTGWITSALMIPGIIYGSTISLTAIAAFYALAYIVLVLPFVIIYVLKSSLGYSSGIASFWLPKFIISFFLWICIYYSFNHAEVVLLICWIILTLWDTQSELIKLSRNFVRLRFLK